MSADFYQIANEVAAQVHAETKGMSEANLKAYQLRGAYEHLAELRRLKASSFLLDHAELRIARLVKELSEIESAKASP